MMKFSNMQFSKEYVHVIEKNAVGIFSELFYRFFIHVKKWQNLLALLKKSVCDDLVN